MEPWPDERLFDAWYLHEHFSPTAVTWPEQMDGWSSTDKERWGVIMAKRALFEHMDGARVIHRGDSPVWLNTYDQSCPIVGDLDVAWGGRSPLVEVKAFLPACRLKALRGAPAQGLDFPQRQDYLNEQNRTGRPFYVLWVWPDQEDFSVVARGERVDLLPWPAHAESLNRLRNVKGAKMVYWEISTLRTVSELVADIESWGGAPFQETLLIA
jgi:hypothetical protein